MLSNVQEVRVMRWISWTATLAVAFLAACGDEIGPGDPIDDGTAPDVGALMCTPSGVTTG